jgi:hypothetical protein
VYQTRQQPKSIRRAYSKPAGKENAILEEEASTGIADELEAAVSIVL